MFLPRNAFSAENKGVLYQSRGMVKHCFGGNLNSLALKISRRYWGLNRLVSDHAAELCPQPFNLGELLSDPFKQS